MKLKWKCTVAGRYSVWRSTDDVYEVWVQGRPLDGSVEWGARLVASTEWLSAHAGSLTEAKSVCVEHASRAAK